MIHPIVNNANQWTRIQGPDSDDKDKNWLIDGHADGAEEGTVYKITFRWTQDGQKSLSWEPCEEVVPNISVHRRDRHIYTLVDARNPARANQIDLSKDGDGLWMCKAPMGRLGRQEFYILRDHDPRQAIYPAATEYAAAGTVPALGPD